MHFKHRYTTRRLMAAVALAAVAISGLTNWQSVRAYRAIAAYHARCERSTRERVQEYSEHLPTCRGLECDQWKFDSHVSVKSGGKPLPPCAEQVRMLKTVLTYHKNMKDKYKKRSWHPWSPTRPDPPEPPEPGI